MFCSTTKSSRWLQRLRSSRGFPESDDTDLEHFLEKIDPPDSDSALTVKTHIVDNRGAVQGRDLINNLLSELFCMGEFQDLSRKKSSRKQHSPTICAQNLRVPSPLPFSRRKVNRELNLEDKEDWDLSAYSQTEVTVIDTSVPSWKFDKMLYRRKNVWKIGDKKGKGLMTSHSLNENADVHVQKKKFKLCSSFKSRENGHQKKLKLLNYLDKEGHEQGKTMVAAFEKKQDNCSQVQEKSFLKKQIDDGSSVILIKSIPTKNKKDVSKAM